MCFINDITSREIELKAENTREMTSNGILKQIDKIGRMCPAFVEVFSALVPETSIEVVLTPKQLKELANGTKEIAHRITGELLPQLRSTDSNRITDILNIKEIQKNPELFNALGSLAMQVQLAELAETVEEVKVIVDRIIRGQENDRLALAKSCELKLLQAFKIKDERTRRDALLKIAHDAEDSRNKLMRSHEDKIKFIQERPERGKFWDKNLKDVPDTMLKIREEINVINRVSFVEAYAYWELGEKEAAIQSLMVQKQFINQVYISDDDFLDRLDGLDCFPDNFWTMSIPKVLNDIKSLEENGKLWLIGD